MGAERADLLLTVALVVGALSIPAAVAAWADRRRPVAALLVLALAGVAAWQAGAMRPGGYALAEVPGAMLRVLATFLR